MLQKARRGEVERKYMYQEMQEESNRREYLKMIKEKDRLTAEKIYGFTSSCLVPRFDSAVTIPPFHKELWEMCCSHHKKVAIAAPRSHAKSTSITLSYVLASVLFRDRRYVLIVSETEGQSIQFLNDIKIELEENEDIINLFGISSFIKDSATDLIVQMEGGYQFRITAKGSEQKVRGAKWRNMRPDLIIGDDLEGDEQVMNKERRKKFHNWLFKALIPCLSDNGIIRIVGTVLHLDSSLEKLLGDETWYTRRYKAHNSDFSEILWEERFSRERLEDIRRGYVSQGVPEGYSQEYLNQPIDENTAYFKRDDILFFDPERIDKKGLRYYSAMDLAISARDSSDYTVIATIGIDSDNKMYVVDVLRGRWDAKEIIDNLFNNYIKYKPEMMVMEGGVIEKSITPYIKDEMYKRSVFIPLEIVTPNKDKQSRARPIQARMRQGALHFDKTAYWYPDVEEELLTFPRGKHDDIIDALAWIGLTMDKQMIGRTKEEIQEDDWNHEFGEDYTDMMSGICSMTGY